MATLVKAFSNRVPPGSRYDGRVTHRLIGIRVVRVDPAVLHGPVLRGKLHRVAVALRPRLFGAQLHTNEVGNGDGHQYANDHDDDDQLDQCESSMVYQENLSSSIRSHKDDYNRAK